MQPATISKRTIKRKRVFLPAITVEDGKTTEVRVRDISTNGALVEANAAPAEGSVIRLVFGSVSAEARVAWADGHWFGLEFVATLSQADLVACGQTTLCVSAPRAYRRDRLQEEDVPVEVTRRTITMNRPVQAKLR